MLGTGGDAVGSPWRDDVVESLSCDFVAFACTCRRIDERGLSNVTSRPKRKSCH